MAKLRSALYWDKGNTPFTVKKKLEGMFAEELPAILDKTMENVAQKAKEKLQSLHKISFPGRSSGISYRSIIKFSRPKTINIFPGKMSQVKSFHIGYYPGYLPEARQLAPKHQVQDYMQYLNTGVKKGMVIAPSPGNSGTKGIMSRAGCDRLRVWTNEMGLVQSSRPYTVKRLRKRKEGTVGRPSKFRVYSREEGEKTYMANTTRQIWMIIKGMEKRGIPGETFGRGKYHLIQFAKYINVGIRQDLLNAFGEGFKAFKKVADRRRSELIRPSFVPEMK